MQTLAHHIVEIVNDTVRYQPVLDFILKL